MEILQGLAGLSGCKKLQYKKVVVTVGKFVTMHNGHVQVIKKAVKMAQQLGGEALIVCVKKHDEESLGIFPTFLLQKAMKNLGVSWILNCTIEELKNLHYIQFLNLLQSKFLLVGWVSSKKLCIGKNKKGTPEKVRDFLSFYGQKNGQKVVVDIINSLKVSTFSTYVGNNIKNIKNINKNGIGFNKKSIKASRLSRELLSSSYVRQLFLRGDVENIANACYFPPCIVGEVVNGYGIGKKLQFPTANVNYPKYLLPGLVGTFIAITKYKDTLLPGMAFVGKTALHGGAAQIELHLFNFSQSLYNRQVEIYLLKKLRNNLDLSDVQQPLVTLKKQLTLDAENADVFFVNNKSLVQQIEKRLRIQTTKNYNNT